MRLSGVQCESEHPTCPSAAQDTTVRLELAGRMRAWKTFALWPDEYLNICLPAPNRYVWPQLEFLSWPRKPER